MPPQPQPPTTTFPIAAQPQRVIFDAWNSSSTGHQRAENRLSGSTAWRDSRTAKLAVQLGAGPSGGERVADTVGAGSEGFVKGERNANGSWKRGIIPTEMRVGGQRGMAEFLGLKKEDTASEQESEGEDGLTVSKVDHEGEVGGDELQATEYARPPQIFTNLTFYINGSTYPVMSDHRLKQELVRHGGRLSLGLGRRSVTHVIVGRSGAGDGVMAAGKIQKEIARTRSAGGNAVRFVTAEWVFDCLRNGRRVGEARFEVLKNRPAGVKGLGVGGSFGTSKGGKS